jgi:hypothetical protein
MPPLCMLINKLLEYSDENPTELHPDEVELMVHFDGILTTHPSDEKQVIAVTIGCYAIPVTQDEANMLDWFQRCDAEDAVQDSYVANIHKGEKSYLGMLGNSRRHHDVTSRAYQKREKGVAEAYRRYEESVRTWGFGPMRGRGLLKSNCKGLPPRGSFNHRSRYTIAGIVRGVVPFLDRGTQ